MPDSRDSASKRAKGRMPWDDDVEIHDLDPALDLGVFADDDMGGFAPAALKEETRPLPGRAIDVVPPLPDVVRDDEIAVPEPGPVVVKFPRAEAKPEIETAAPAVESDPPPPFANPDFAGETTRQARTPAVRDGTVEARQSRDYSPLVAVGLLAIFAIGGGAYLWSRQAAPRHAAPASVTASRGTAPEIPRRTASAAGAQGAASNRRASENRRASDRVRTPLASAPAPRSVRALAPHFAGASSRDSRSAPPTPSAGPSERARAPASASGARSVDHVAATVGRSGASASFSRTAPALAQARPPKPAPPRDANGAIAGWLRVEAASELQLTVDGIAMGSTRQAPLLLAAGTHTLDLASDRAGVRTTTRVTVAPGEVAVVPITLPQGTLSVTAQPDADVFVDGQPAGRTPVDHVALTVGVRRILVRHPELGERSYEIVVREGRQTQLSVDLRPR